MDWKNMLVGIAFLFGAFLIFKMRKWGNTDGDQYVAINKIRVFGAWMVIFMCVMVGIVLIVKAL